MRKISLFGRELSAVALGSTDFGGTIPESTAIELLDAFHEIGGNYLDTAHVYGDFVTPKNGVSEAIIGRWLEETRSRGKIFLSTKGGHPVLGHMDEPRLDRASIRRDIMESLEALRTDHVDIFWLHRDDADRPVGDILETLQQLAEEGLTLHTGVSNWRPARIREANAYAASHGLRPIEANQPRFSLAEQVTVEDPTLVPMDAEGYRMHMETGMPCIPFSSQAKGFFTKLDTIGADALPAKAKRRFYTPENLAVYERLLRVRESTGLSVGALAVAWLTSQPFPVLPLCGASRAEQVYALKEAADAEIAPEQRDYIRRMI